MNEEKRRRHKILALQFDLPLIILIAGALALIVLSALAIANGISLAQLDAVLGNLMYIYGVLTILIFIAIIVLTCLRTRFLHGRRYNEDIFATDRGVFSEKMFVDSISKKVVHYHNKAAVIAFSIFELKKTVLNMFGYQMVAKIAGSISSTLINRYSDKSRRDVVYGFDYNENFLLFLPYEDRPEDVDVEIAKLNDEIQKTIQQSGLNMDIAIFYGIYLHQNANLSAYEMIRRALIAADFGLRNKIGINRFEEYMIDANQNDLILANEIAAALDKREFEIFFQPKFDIKLNRFIVS